MESRILLVEDDREIAGIVALHLREAGYVVDIVKDATSAFSAVDRGGHDLVVLDLMLPRGGSGLDVCRRLRAQERYTPILMLTARASEVDRVIGLELGADDYVTKPFSIRELVARVRALLRRSSALAEQSSPPGEASPIRVADLLIDSERREVQVGKRRVQLTPREFDLLVQFARHPGRVYTRSQLLDLVWGYGHSGYEHTVNAHINRLRAKIEQDPTRPRYICTVWGVGYRLRDLKREGLHDPTD